MALVPQKCQYALRAVFELAAHYGRGPLKIAAIAEAQAVPQRFLEVILAQLKQGGFVESQRGSEGGYWLVQAPDRLTVGEVMTFMQGPVTVVACQSGGAPSRCPLQGECVFMPMWDKVAEAISAVYDHTTFQDLIDEKKRRTETWVPSYSI
jgi:Rrf2 family protein